MEQQKYYSSNICFWWKIESSFLFEESVVGPLQTCWNERKEILLSLQQEVCPEVPKYFYTDSIYQKKPLIWHEAMFTVEFTLLSIYICIFNPLRIPRWALLLRVGTLILPPPIFSRGFIGLVFQPRDTKC